MCFHLSNITGLFSPNSAIIWRIFHKIGCQSFESGLTTFGFKIGLALAKLSFTTFGLLGLAMAKLDFTRFGFGFGLAITGFGFAIARFGFGTGFVYRLQPHIIYLNRKNF